MDNLIRDLRYGMRYLVRRPAYTIAAVVALALGIGASTAIFSVLYAALWRNLPYREADRLVIVWEDELDDPDNQNVANPANYMDWKEQNHVFQDMAATVDDLSNLTGSGEPEEIPSQRVTPNFFSVLGTSAMMGRTFSTEDKASDEREVVLSYGLWQRRFGADPGIIGRKLILNGRETTVIGVMPANFRWFIKKGSFIRKPAEMWTPRPITPQRRTREGRYLTVLARLNPGVSEEQAQADMTLLAQRLEKQFKEFNTNWGANVVPLRQQLTGDVRMALIILSGAVGFVLLIACTNVANLMLARAVSGTKEIAVRSALGAGPFQIVRQLFTESVLLAMLGGTAGLFLAVWGIDALGALGSLYGIELQNITLSMPVLIFTVAISFLTALIFGIIPAWHASRWNVQEHLRESSRGNTSAGGNSRNILIVAEIALALVLLTGAGLLIQSFSRLSTVNPGFNAENIMTFRLVLPDAKYPEESHRIAFFQQVGERLQALPGVESAGAVSFLPFAGPASATTYAIGGRSTPPFGQEPVTEVFLTDQNFFHTMQIPLKRGRLFNRSEVTEAKRVVIINETLARVIFPNEDRSGRVRIFSCSVRHIAVASFFVFSPPPSRSGRATSPTSNAPPESRIAGSSPRERSNKSTKAFRKLICRH